MPVDPADFEEIPSNRHDVHAGSLLIPTRTPVVPDGSSAMDFVIGQGGDADTFVFMFGVRPMFNLAGAPVGILEGVFLSESGPGFHPTWDFEQLLGEIDRGGWRVVTTPVVLEEWIERIEARMNR
jgi:hypothetical protein